MLDRVRIWEAARATSAATSFFEPLFMDGKAFADGATGANNPIYELWAEASSVFSEDESWKLEDNLKCLISVGTGIPSLKPFGPGITDVAGALKAIATASESTAQQFQRQHPFLVKNSIYSRFNVTHGLEDVGLEEADRLGDIEAITYNYCASTSVMQQIEFCANVLKRIPCTYTHALGHLVSRATLSKGCRLMQAVGIPEAVSRFNNRFQDPYLKNLYQTQLDSLPETEVDRYVHTRAFREWFAGDRNMIVCAAPRGMAKTPCTLGACMAKYVVDQTCCHLLYVDCYWMLQTPKQAKQKKFAPDLLKSELKHGPIKREDSVDLVLESIYDQLFGSCLQQRDILESYYCSLPQTEAVLFQSKMMEKGIPQKNHLWNLTQHLLRSTNAKVLICIDRIHELEEASCARLMSLLKSLNSLQTTHKVILCGDASEIDQDSLLGTPIVSEETETRGNHQFPR